MEEKQRRSVSGTVALDAEYFRDLVYNTAKAESRAEEYAGRFYSSIDKIRRLEEENEALRRKLKDIKGGA